MKQFLLLTSVLIFAVGCGTNNLSPAVSAPATQPVASAQPINKHCAVDKDGDVDPTVTYLYKGKVIGFCCKDCIEKFKQDPDKYMATLK